jgi:SEC-C motif-containing protein
MLPLLQFLHDYIIAPSLSLGFPYAGPVLPHVPAPADTCPCGSGATYDACCGPLLANRVQAGSPEQLMRSRYTAFVVGDADHLFRTWHPRTRPDDVSPDPATRWTGLEVLAATGDTVEFVASWEGGRMHELSRFEQRGGRWVYVDGDQLA